MPINPLKITNFNSTVEELEEVLLFWICASGKNALIASSRLDRFLYSLHRWKQDSSYRPFESIRKYGPDRLAAKMKSCGIGCYNSKAKAFWQLANAGLDLRTCSVEDLEQVHGIGMKTSRCFLIHSRRNADVAGLDVHILKYLQDQGHEVPKATPARKEYLRIEKIFVQLARKARKSVAAFDLSIWKKYRKKQKVVA